MRSASFWSSSVGAPLEVVLALVERLGAFLDSPELLVQPLLAIGEAQLTSL